MEKDKVARDKYGEWLPFCLSGKIDERRQICYTFWQKKSKKELTKIWVRQKLIDIKKRRKTENRPSRKRKETVCWDDRMLDRIFRIFLLSGEKADDKDRTQYDSSERIYEQSVQYRQCHRVTVRKSNQKAEGYYNKDRTPIGSVMLCRWGFCVCRKMWDWDGRHIMYTFVRWLCDTGYSPVSTAAFCRASSTACSSMDAVYWFSSE